MRQQTPSLPTCKCNSQAIRLDSALLTCLAVHRTGLCVVAAGERNGPATSNTRKTGNPSRSNWLRLLLVKGRPQLNLVELDLL